MVAVEESLCDEEPADESASEQEDSISPPAVITTARQAIDIYFLIKLLRFMGSPFVKKRLCRFENDSIL